MAERDVQPARLAYEWVDRKGQGGKASAYIASLIEADIPRELALEQLRAFGYTGSMEITAEGKAKARTRLNEHTAPARNPQ